MICGQVLTPVYVCRSLPSLYRAHYIKMQYQADSTALILTQVRQPCCILSPCLWYGIGNPLRHCAHTGRFTAKAPGQSDHGSHW